MIKLALEDGRIAHPLAMLWNTIVGTNPGFPDRTADTEAVVLVSLVGEHSLVK